MNKINYLIIYLKGMAMGISDLIPGISGGTIALITCKVLGECLSSNRPPSARHLDKPALDQAVHLQALQEQLIVAATATAAADPCFFARSCIGVPLGKVSVQWLEKVV